MPRWRSGVKLGGIGKLTGLLYAASNFVEARMGEGVVLSEALRFCHPIRLQAVDVVGTVDDLTVWESHHTVEPLDSAIFHLPTLDFRRHKCHIWSSLMSAIFTSQPLSCITPLGSLARHGA